MLPFSMFFVAVHRIIFALWSVHIYEHPQCSYFNDTYLHRKL